MAIKTHVITGDLMQVVAAVDRARADGRLVAVTEARLLPGDEVRLIANLRSAGGSRWQRMRPWLIGLGKALVVLAVSVAVAGLLWLIGWAAMALVGLASIAVAWLHAHLLEIGVVVAVTVIGLVSVFTGGGDRCGGVHCRGCGR